MEDCVQQGLVKSIGISNFNSKQIARLLEHCKIKPATNQVEIHPYFPQNKLGAFCAERGIPLTGFGALGAPRRPAQDESDPIVLEDETLKKIADKNGKTVAQVLIRWQIQRGNFVIPKSVTPERIASNFDVFNFNLDAEDMSLINGLDRNHRLFAMTRFKGVVPHKYSPFVEEF